MPPRRGIIDRAGRLTPRRGQMCNHLATHTFVPLLSSNHGGAHLKKPEPRRCSVQRRSDGSPSSSSVRRGSQAAGTETTGRRKRVGSGVLFGHGMGSSASASNSISSILLLSTDRVRYWWRQWRAGWCQVATRGRASDRGEESSSATVWGAPPLLLTPFPPFYYCLLTQVLAVAEAGCVGDDKRKGWRSR